MIEALTLPGYYPLPDAPAETLSGTVVVPGRVQYLGGSLEDGIRNAFMLVPTQKRRMELLGLLFRADEQLTANEEAQSCPS